MVFSLPNEHFRQRDNQLRDITVLPNIPKIRAKRILDFVPAFGNKLRDQRGRETKGGFRRNL